MEHSRFSPSSAHRWSRCTASVEFIEACGATEETKDAAEFGRQCHEHAEKVLLGKQSVRCVPEEYRDIVGGYCRHVWVHAEDALFWGVETQVSLERILGPGQFGTIDFCAVYLDHIYLCDLKTGRTEVAPDSEQLLIYAAGMLAKYPSIDEIEVEVYQPVIGNFENVVLTRSEVLKRVQPFTDAVKKITSGESAFNPGDRQCRWCPALAECQAAKDAIFETVFEKGGDLKDVNKVPVSELADVLGKIGFIDSYTSAVQARAYGLLESGYEIPGYKLVIGRPGPRSWENPTAVEDAIKRLRIKKADAYESKLKSPTQIEKSIGPTKYDALSVYVTRKEGKKVIAPISDKREAVTISAEDMFPESRSET